MHKHVSTKPRSSARFAETTAAADDVDAQIRWRTVRAKLLARRGDIDASERLSLEAVALVAQTDFVNIHADVLMHRADALVLCGRHPEAVEAARQAARLYEAKGNQVGATRARTQIGALADQGREAMP